MEMIKLDKFMSAFLSISIYQHKNVDENMHMKKSLTISKCLSMSAKLSMNSATMPMLSPYGTYIPIYDLYTAQACLTKCSWVCWKGNLKEIINKTKINR